MTDPTPTRDEAVREHTDRYHKRPFTGFAPRDEKRRKQVVSLPMDVLLAIVRERLAYLQHGSDLDAVAQFIACEIERAMGVFPNLDAPASAPAPASGGVDAGAAFAVASNLLRDGCTYADRKAAADFIRSALSPAETPVSEAGGEADRQHGMNSAIRLARYQLRRGANDLGVGEVDTLLRMVVACGEDGYIPLAEEGSEAAEREGSPLQRAVLIAAQRLSLRRGVYWPTVDPEQQKVFLAEVMSVVASIDEERGGPGHHYGLGYAQGQADLALAKPASSPAGVREAAELLSHLKLYVLEKLDPADADMLHDRIHDLTAALSQSTSAGRVGE